MLALVLTGRIVRCRRGIGISRAVWRLGADGGRVHLVCNELRQGGKSIADATRDAAMLRLRPIMMTALVAAFGFLPAALATGSRNGLAATFALVIVGGLFSLVVDIGVFDAGTLRMAARPGDRLEV